ncbi:hypothetical protein OG365_24260 [Streptomyces sp. NBC_00853]|uniref:hypothetical protein n=1 Tax=Streptomyces sp. NBC_00853 TaxID=2903681 RepID=UPI003872EFF0|nr:hypothetical protein OG365_24260 [Streptomyces sp. NBC_00853]
MNVVPVAYVTSVTTLAASKIVELAGDRWDSVANVAQAAVIIAATGHVALYGAKRMTDIGRRVRRLMRIADAVNEGGTVNDTDAGTA